MATKERTISPNNPLEKARKQERASLRDRKRKRNFKPINPEMYGKPISIKPNDDDYPHGLDDLGKEIMDIISLQYEERQERTAMVDAFRQQYEETRGYMGGKGPFEGSADVHTPMTRNDVDVLHAELLRVCTGVEPYIRLRQRRTGNVDQAHAELLQKREAFLHSRLENEINFRSLMDRVLKRSIIDGTCVVEVCWRKEYRIENDRELIDEDLIRKLAKDKTPEEQEQALAQAQTNGIEYKGEKLEFGVDYLEVQADTVTADHPDLIRHDIHDVVVYPVRTEEIKDTILFGNRVWATENDLYRGVDEGYYDLEAVERLLDEVKPNGWYRGSPYPYEPDNEGIGKDGTNIIGGMNKHNPYELFKVVYDFDANNDGRAEKCLFTVDASKNIILRAQPLPYWSGEIPYIAYRPFPRDGFFFGEALPEILEGLQEVSDVVMDQMLDAGTLANSPFVTRLAGSNSQLNVSRLMIGKIFDVDDHNDFQIHNWNIPSQDNFLDHNVVMNMAEMLTGVTDAKSGVSSGTSRPLGETQRLLEQAGIRFEVIIGRVQDYNRLAAFHVISFERQYLDPESEEEITGEPAGLFSGISKSELRRSLNIYPLGNNRNTSREMEMVSAEKTLLASANSPAMQAPPQHWEVMRKFLKAHGNDDYETFIDSKENFVKRMEESQNKKPPAEPPSLSGKMDEIMTLAKIMQDESGGQMTYVQALAAASQLAQQLGIGGDAGAQQKVIGMQGKLTDQQTDFNKQMALQEVKTAEDMARREIINSQELANLELQNNEQLADTKIAASLSLAEEKVKNAASRDNNKAGSRTNGTGGGKGKPSARSRRP